MVAITHDHQLHATGAFPATVAMPRRPDLRVVPPLSTPVGRRRPIDLALAALAAAVLIVAAGYLLLSPALAEPGTIPVADATYVVEAGETMWSIAQEQAPAGEAATYVERLVSVNGTSVVEPGQTLRLPRS